MKPEYLNKVIDYSKKIYNEKAQFLHKFSERMSIEVEGNIVIDEMQRLHQEQGRS